MFHEQISGYTVRPQQATVPTSWTATYMRNLTSPVFMSTSTMVVCKAWPIISMRNFSSSS